MDDRPSDRQNIPVTAGFPAVHSPRPCSGVDWFLHRAEANLQTRVIYFLCHMRFELHRRRTGLILQRPS